MNRAVPSCGRTGPVTVAPGRIDDEHERAAFARRERRGQGRCGCSRLNLRVERVANERGDLLADAVLPDGEVALGQVGDLPSLPIDHADVKAHEVQARPEGRCLVLGSKDQAGWPAARAQNRGEQPGDRREYNDVQAACPLHTPHQLDYPFKAHGIPSRPRPKPAPSGTRPA